MVVQRISVFCLVIGALTVLATVARESRGDLIYSYDASLGSLPTAQGWTLSQDDPNYPAPTVNGGILHQFPQITLSQQIWSQKQMLLDFTTTSYTYELNLHIISSNYINNGSAQRSGYNMNLFDQVGRTFAVGIASNGITINTDSNSVPSNGVPFTPFNTTDGFHIYRLTIDHSLGLGSLFIDGSFFASTPVGSIPAVDPGNLNRVFFGDAAGVGISESELRFAHFSTGAVPEPASVITLGTGILSLLDRLFAVENQ